MCSICRNKKCTYKFNQDKWKLEDDLVIIPLAETDLTMLEQVRVFEETMRTIIDSACGIKLLPPKRKRR